MSSAEKAVAALALRNRDGSPALDTSGSQRWRTISPLWTMQSARSPSDPPQDGVISERYHKATIVLSESAVFRATWSDALLTRFFQTRDRFIAACDAAMAENWAEVASKFEQRRYLNDQAQDLAKAARRFHRALATAPSRLGAPARLSALFIQSVEHSTADKWVADLDSFVTLNRGTGGHLAPIAALAEYFERCDDWGGGVFQFGPIGYAKVPKRLPNREVALALILADRFAGGSVHLPKTPALSENTPWRAIRFFVDSALAEDPNTVGNRPESANLQRRVLAAIRAGAKVGLRAD
jgi:hypothetical protein